VSTPAIVYTADSPYVCGWTMDTCEDKLINGDQDLVGKCITSAAEILYALSGRQFGLCEVTVRPCYKKCAEGYPGMITWDNGILGASGYPWLPVLSGGLWMNVACGCRTSCDCTTVCEVSLPGPVDSVQSVKLDGVVLGSGEYRVDNDNRLVRLSEGCWPKCQNMALTDDEVGTWSVTYMKGRPLPEAGRMALSRFASELFLGCTNDPGCKLPSRVTSIQRQGITMALLDPMTFIELGRTGIYQVDLWIRTVNPKGRSRGAAVMSPDAVPPRRTTWQG